MKTERHTHRTRRRAARSRICEELPIEESGIAGEILMRLRQRASRRKFQREVMRDFEAATGIAVAFAGRRCRELPSGTFDALRDQIFIVLSNSDEARQATVRRALAELGWIVNDIWAAQINAAVRPLLRPVSCKQRIA